MNVTQVAGHLSRPVGVLALTAVLVALPVFGIIPDPSRAIALPKNTPPRPETAPDPPPANSNSNPFATQGKPGQNPAAGTRSLDIRKQRVLGSPGQIVPDTPRNTDPFDTNTAPDQTIPGGTRNSLPRPFSDRGRPGQTSGAGTRGWCPFSWGRSEGEADSEPDLREQMILLADVNYPHTLASHPAFLIYTPPLLEVNTIQVSLFIRQADGRTGARVYKANLPVSPEGGLLRFEFPAEMPGLEVGQPYWFDVDLNCFVDGDKTSLVLLRAPLERVSLPEAATLGMNAVVNSSAVNPSNSGHSGAVNSGANIGASSGGSQGELADGALSPALEDWRERDRWLAEHQLWYDRLAWVAEQWQQRPQDPQLLQHWRTLLTALELDPDLIPEPSVTCCASPELESFEAMESEAVESPEPSPAIAPLPTP